MYEYWSIVAGYRFDRTSGRSSRSDSCGFKPSGQVGYALKIVEGRGNAVLADGLWKAGGEEAQ